MSDEAQRPAPVSGGYPVTGPWPEDGWTTGPSPVDLDALLADAVDDEGPLATTHCYTHPVRRPLHSISVSPSTPSLSTPPLIHFLPLHSFTFYPSTLSLSIPPLFLFPFFVLPAKTN